MNATKIHWAWILVIIAIAIGGLIVANQRITTVHCAGASAPAACQP
jgi:hypothetical protein